MFHHLKPMVNSSLEANHLIWVWIMKVKRPKNQADFIEVQWNLHIVSQGPVTQIFSFNNAENWIWPPDYEML